MLKTVRASVIFEGEKTFFGMTNRIPSALPEFCKLSPKERLEYLREVMGLSKEEAEPFISTEPLRLESAERMIENVVGFMPVPLGIATGLIVNGREYFVPMATEQRSVVWMVTAGAQLTRATGGFKASAAPSIMIGQIQLTRVEDFRKARESILVNKESILEEANTQSGTRKAVDVEVREVSSAIGPMLVVELLVNVRDSMGANVVDSMCEKVAPIVESLSGGSLNLRVVSSLATRRLVHIKAVVSKHFFENTDIVDRIVDASVFAENDPFRAATHNKGIMNGVSAVLLATCNDTRAVEAGAHSYAAMSGQYRPLSVWHRNEEGDLSGKLTMPMAIGTVGGAVSTHPTARAALKMLGVRTASELGEVAASAGLAYNLAALQALVTTRICPCLSASSGKEREKSD
jgi:hydroxymethylglutaryl-CoA reductase